MKACVRFLVVWAILFSSFSEWAYAQRYGGGGGRGAGGYGGSGRAPNQAPRPQAPEPPKSGSTNQFSALPASSGFYFLADTNRANLWIKISGSMASNSVNHKLTAVMPATRVRVQ